MKKTIGKVEAYTVVLNILSKLINKTHKGLEDDSKHKDLIKDMKGQLLGFHKVKSQVEAKVKQIEKNRIKFLKE